MATPEGEAGTASPSVGEAKSSQHGPKCRDQRELHGRREEGKALAADLVLVCAQCRGNRSGKKSQDRYCQEGWPSVHSRAWWENKKAKTLLEK